MQLTSERGQGGKGALCNGIIELGLGPGRPRVVRTGSPADAACRGSTPGALRAVSARARSVSIAAQPLLQRCTGGSPCATASSRHSTLAYMPASMMVSARLRSSGTSAARRWPWRSSVCRAYSPPSGSAPSCRGRSGYSCAMCQGREVAGRMDRSSRMPRTGTPSLFRPSRSGTV